MTCNLTNFYPSCKNEISFLVIEINVANNLPSTEGRCLTTGIHSEKFIVR